MRPFRFALPTVAHPAAAPAPATARATLGAAVLTTVFAVTGTAVDLGAQGAAPNGPAAGRQESPAVHAVRGEVLQAETGEPIPGATVLLVPAGPGLLGGGNAADEGGSAFLGTGRRARTDSAGRYQLPPVPPGTYVLRVSRLGFRPATVEIELRGTPTVAPGSGPDAATRISVGLSVATVRLRPVTVAADAPEPYARRARSAREVGDARARALRARQARFLTTDVREVTHADVDEALTTGETDLFRALQRLPGVATRSDATAELWTRGGRWDQTRVTFDGLPLFNPLHAGGVLSAVNADAVGAALLFPGVRPAAVPEGGAAALDLRSRAGGGTGALRGVGEVSLVSARAALDRTVAGGRGAWMVAGRRSYVDVLTRDARDPDDRVPYAVGEVAARADWRVGRAHALEASALHTVDRIADRSAFEAAAGDGATGATGRPSAGPGTDGVTPAARGDRWGNTLARLTLAGPATLGPLGEVRLRHTAGVTVYRADVVLVDSAAPPGSAFRDWPVRAGVTYATVSGEATAADAGGEAGPARWTLGYAATWERVRTAGRLRAVYVGEGDTAQTASAAALPVGALWGERRLTPAPRLTVVAGLRVEAGPPVRGAGPVRPAPRLTARYALGDGDAVSAGLGRHVQYVQGAPGLSSVAAPGVRLPPVPLWRLAGADVPALVADLVTVGWERWTTSGWDLTVNAYARRSTGVLGPDLRPGPVAGRALAVAGAERAGGAELGARRLVGRWTGAANYAVGRATTAAGGLRYASAEEQRHVFHATGMVRVGRGLRLGAAYSAFSGAPFTRLVPPPAPSDPGAADPASANLPPAAVQAAALGAPNAGRLPAFGRMDLSAEWSFAVRRVRAGAYVQVINALRQRNVLAYDGPAVASAGCRTGGDAGAAGACRPADTFAAGIPAFPFVGLRASF
jgi:hypothetical protein